MPAARTVTVVMPCYNAERYIGAAIDSVLAQTVPVAEIIVVDDRSTDQSIATAMAFGDIVRVVSLPTNSGGCVVPKHVGVHEARTEFVALLDADDLWVPRKLELQLPLFADPAVGMVYGRAQTFIDGHAPDGLPWPEALPTGEVTREFFERCWAPNSTVVGRREALTTGGGFDTSLDFCEDFDLWLRVALEWKVAAVPDVLMLYRTHAGQLTKNRAKQVRWHFHVERKHAAAVAARTGLSVDELRRLGVARVMGLIAAEYYGQRDFQAANLLGELLLEEHPGLDAASRRFLATIKRRSRLPKFLFTWRDRFDREARP